MNWGASILFLYLSHYYSIIIELDICYQKIESKDHTWRSYGPCTFVLRRVPLDKYHRMSRVLVTNEHWQSLRPFQSRLDLTYEEEISILREHKNYCIRTISYRDNISQQTFHLIEYLHRRCQYMLLLQFLQIYEYASLESVRNAKEWNITYFL